MESLAKKTPEGGGSAGASAASSSSSSAPGASASPADQDEDEDDFFNCGPAANAVLSIWTRTKTGQLGQQLQKAPNGVTNTSAVSPNQLRADLEKLSPRERSRLLARVFVNELTSTSATNQKNLYHTSINYVWSAQDPADQIEGTTGEPFWTKLREIAEMSRGHENHVVSLPKNRALAKSLGKMFEEATKDATSFVRWIRLAVQFVGEEDVDSRFLKRLVHTFFETTENLREEHMLFLDLFCGGSELHRFFGGPVSSGPRGKSADGNNQQHGGGVLNGALLDLSGEDGETLPKNYSLLDSDKLHEFWARVTRDRADQHPTEFFYLIHFSYMSTWTCRTIILLRTHTPNTWL